MKIKKKQSGFTLIELITVVSLISLLVVYITVELGQSNDDAKVAMATTFLLGNVPQAIGSYKARHLGSCAGLSGTFGGNYAGTTDGDTAASDAKQFLVARGLHYTTPWGEFWDAAYDNGERTITVTYPTDGSDDSAQAEEDILLNLANKPQIDALEGADDADIDEDDVSGDDIVTVVYDCV